MTDNNWKDKAEELKEQAGARVNEVKGQVTDKATEAKNQLGDKAERTKSRTEDKLEEFKLHAQADAKSLSNDVKDVVHKLQDGAKEGWEKVKDALDGDK